MKNLTVIIAILLFSFSLQAQNHLFVKAGTAYSDVFVSTVPNEKRNFKFGPQVGVLYFYQFPNKWNVRAELLYSIKGFKSLNFQGTESIHRFDYLNMPLLIGYQIGKFNFEMGPELGYVLFEFLKSDDQYANVGAVVENRFEIGVVTGISYELLDQLLLNFRFSQGLTSIFNVFYTDTGIGGSEEKVYNQSFQLSVALKLF